MWSRTVKQEHNNVNISTFSKYKWSKCHRCPINAILEIVCIYIIILVLLVPTNST